MRTSAFCLILLVIGIASAQDSLNVRCVGGYQFYWSQSYCVALDSARDLAFIGATNTVYVLDVSNPTSPVELSRVWVNDQVHGICYENGRMYVAGYRAGLRIFSVSNPAHPVELAHCDSLDRPIDVKASGDHAYVLDNRGLLVVSIADPAHPVELGRYDTPGGPNALAVVGNLAYVAAGWFGLRVISVADPTQPTEVGSCDSASDTRGVAVSGNIACLADGDSNKVLVISVADPSNPTEVGNCNTPEFAYGVAMDGNYAYVADMDSSGLLVISVADPAHPAEVGHCSGGGYRCVSVLEGYAYAAGLGGLLGVVSIVNPARPVLSGLYHGSLGFPYGVAVFRDYAYIADDSGPLRVISLSDPTQPFEAGQCAMPTGARGVAVSGDYAYVADLSAGLRVVSIADPAHPHEVGFVNTNSARAVALSSAYAYVADDSAGLRVISVADPTHPVEVGHYSGTGRVYGVAVSGALAYLASDNNGLRIVSVTDPAHPVEVGYCGVPGGAYGVAVRGDYACVAARDSGLRVISVSDPTHPTEVGHCDTLGPTSSVATSRDYAYVRTYDGGMRVVSIADPANPAEVGYYSFGGLMTPSSEVALDGGYVYVVDNFAMRILRFYGGPADQLGDLDVDPDSLDVAADTLRLRGSGSSALGAFVLANTSASYNPDPKDGPSLSRVDSLHFIGSLTGPGGALDSILIPNLPTSLLEAQTAICTLEVHVPSGLQDGDYAGAITIAGKDVNDVLVDVTFYAHVRVRGGRVQSLGDLDVDNDSLDVKADTIRLRVPEAGDRIPGSPDRAVGAFVLANTSTSYNPDTIDGPSLSWVDSLRFTGSLTGPGGTLDSILIPNLPASLAQGQTVVCTLAVFVPPGLRDGNYSGPITISGRDSLGFRIDETVYARVTKLGDLDVDNDSLDVVRDTMNLRTQPAGPVYSPYAKAEFMLVNTSQSYNPDTADGPSRSPLREVKVEVKVEAQGRAAPKVNSECRIVKSGTDFHSSQFTLDSSAVGVYVLNLPESLAVGQAVKCTLALVIPVGESLGGYSGWVTISARDTLGFSVQDSFFLAVRGPQPRQNLDSLRVAPIPFKPNQNPEHDAIHFQGLSAGARVTVYDASGQSVWSATENGDGHLKWDAKVASGIYVYLVVAKDGQSKVGKLSVIR